MKTINTGKYLSKTALLKIQNTLTLIEVESIIFTNAKCEIVVKNLDDLYAVQVDEKKYQFQKRDKTDAFRWQAGREMVFLFSDIEQSDFQEETIFYHPLALSFEFAPQPIAFFQKGLRIMHDKILKMQEFESKQAIFKYVDLLLWVAVKTIHYRQKDAQEQLLIEVEILEEVFAELSEKSEELVFKEGYDADFPQKNFQMSYPNADEVLVLENYWQFPYLNIALNFDMKVIKKFKERKIDWMEDMY